MARLSAPRVYGSCSACNRRFNVMAPSGVRDWTGKCAGCGAPIKGTVAGVRKPDAEQEERPARKSTIPKVSYTEKEKDDATPEKDRPEPADDAAESRPPVIPAADANAGAGEPAGSGVPRAEAGAEPGDAGSGGEKADSEPNGKPAGKAVKRGSKHPVRTRGTYDHIGLPY